MSRRSNSRKVRGSRGATGIPSTGRAARRRWPAWIVGGLAVCAGAGSANAVSMVVINEVLGSTQSTDWEYIELYNAGSSSVNISSWQVEFWDSDSGSTYGGRDGGSPYVIPGTTILAPGGHYLMANGFAQDPTFGMTALGKAITPNFTFQDNGIENSAYTVALRDNTNVVVDTVYVSDGGASDSANIAGTPITPGASVGPDGTFLPAGFTRTTDGGSTLAILPFSYADIVASPLAASPISDGVTVLSSVVDARIYAIQGNGDASPLLGNTVSTDGVVTRINSDGFYIQDTTGDGDASTSDGVFVFTGSNAVTGLAVGQVVNVVGQVSEFGTKTNISGSSLVVTQTGQTAGVSPVTLSFPVNSVNDLEKYEGMLVQLDQQMVMSEYFNLDRFGEVRLSTQLFDQFTQTNAPSVSGFAAHLDQVARSAITLDDGSSVQNPNPIPLLGDPSLGDPVNVIRRGDVFTNIVGTLDFTAGAWNIDPTVDPTITSTNPRPAETADVQGGLKVASINALNLFNGDGQGGGFPTPRGAFTLDQYNVQLDKLVATVRGTGAQIVGLQELENDQNTSIPAVQSLVDALNATATGGETWAFVNTGAVGGDVIAVGFIYRADLVAPEGAASVLDSSDDSRFDDTRNRPAIAQTFVDLTTGGVLTVVNNHFKSKGGSGTTGLDVDQLDGQGQFNFTRTQAALALIDWIANDPTASGDSDFLLIGDFNSYQMEDPIMALLAGGYTNLLAQFEGTRYYEYIFDGQAGALSHLFASSSLMAQVSDAGVWHINADEPDAYDYLTRFGKNPLYTAAGPYRSSDHDPVIVGLNLTRDRLVTPPIPEPVSASLAGLAVAGLGAALSRRRR